MNAQPVARILWAVRQELYDWHFTSTPPCHFLTEGAIYEICAEPGDRFALHEEIRARVRQDVMQSANKQREVLLNGRAPLD
jgi:hypothetical protein